MKARRLSNKSHSSRRRCTKGASKQRRDSLNTHINQMRLELPLPDSEKQQLSQIQVMALARAYIRCTTRLADVFEIRNKTWNLPSKFNFAEALPGFLLVVSGDSRLMYVSDNVKSYLGYSSVDLLTRNGTIYDIVSEGDRAQVQTVLQDGFKACQGSDNDEELARSKAYMLACRLRVSRSVRRQSRCDRYKLIYIRGHFITKKTSGLESSATSLFVGICSAQPCVQPQDSNTFTSKHATDLKFKDIDECGEFHLGYSKSELSYRSLYSIVHPNDTEPLADIHRQVMRGESTFASVSVRVQTSRGDFLSLTIRLQRCKTRAAGQHIICSSSILDSKEMLKVWPKSGGTVEENKLHAADNWSIGHRSADRAAKKPRMASAGERYSKKPAEGYSRSQAVGSTVNYQSDSLIASEFSSEIVQPTRETECNYFDLCLEESCAETKGFSFVEELKDVQSLQDLLHCDDEQDYDSLPYQSPGYCVSPVRNYSRKEPNQIFEETYSMYGSTVLSPVFTGSCQNSLDYDSSTGFSDPLHLETSCMDRTSDLYTLPLTPCSLLAGSPSQQNKICSADLLVNEQEYMSPSVDSFLAELLSLPEVDAALLESLLAKESYSTGGYFESSQILNALQRLLEN